MRRRNRKSAWRIGAPAAAMVWSLLAPVGPAAAGMSVSVVLATEPTYTIGEHASAVITISNTSTAPESAGTLTLDTITVVPSCATFAAGDCPAASLDPLVFRIISATGTGGACAGTAFAPSTAVPPGSTWRLDPNSPAPVVLGPPSAPTATCQITLGLQASKRPTKDAQPAAPGAQTFMLASATASSSVTGSSGSGSSAAVTTVNRAVPTLTTRAEPQVTGIPDTVHDVATVAGVDGSFPPTGGVIFTVYADPPGAAPCSGPAQDLGLVGLTPAPDNPPPVSTATSPPVVTVTQGTYRFVASYIGDANYESLPTSPCGAPGENVAVGIAAARYTPLTPARILDTRVGIGGISSPVGPGARATVQVTGRGGVPDSGVDAVAMNVTVTNPTAADSYLTVFPAGALVPLASNLNFTAGKTVPNLVIAHLGGGGAVDMYNAAGTVDVVVDVAGWFSTRGFTGDGRFQALNPTRVLDTRTGLGAPAVHLGPGGSLDLQVSGQAGVPVAGAQAVVMNVAVTNTTGAGYLTAHPTGEPRPLAANLNWAPGDTVGNRVIAKLGAGGRVTLYNNAGDADVVVDVNGWFTGAGPPAINGGFVPRHPDRILDTRIGAGPLGAGTTLELKVTGRGGVSDTGVGAVVLNITAVTPEGSGYLTVHPLGGPRPLASDLNYAPGEIRPNLVVVKLGAGGRVGIFTSSTTDLVVDVAGFFLAGELAGDGVG